MWPSMEIFKVTLFLSKFIWSNNSNSDSNNKVRFTLRVLWLKKKNFIQTNMQIKCPHN